MESAGLLQVWIYPPRYWTATQSMTDAQKTDLLDRIEQLIQARDVAALREYEFVELNPTAMSLKYSDVSVQSDPQEIAGC